VPHPAELKQQIDELALRLVMGDSDVNDSVPLCLSALESIRDCAVRGQAPAVAAAASALLAALPSSPAPAAVMSEGIAALQRAVEQAGSPAPAPREHAVAQDPELLTDFIVESRDHLSQIETQLLTLERDPFDSEALNSTFRGFHTIKGLAGFLELWDVQKIAHEVEAVLDRARNGEFTIASQAIDVILASADHLRHWLGHLQSNLQGQPSETPQNPGDLLARIARLLDGNPDGDRPALDVDGQPGLEAATTARPADDAESRAAATESRASASAAPRSEAMAVKVDTRKLDYLVDMAGEMVIAESLVRHDTDLSAIKSPLLQRKIAHLTRITAELQKTAMAMRLVPVGPQFRRMARLVRDLARQFDKRVEMETKGDDIELDRTIVEELADPLMHMVRNAMDHGIEMPEEREKAGKSPVARLVLRASHQAGQVVIEISDDGRGLDRQKILNKAIQKGLVASGDGMSDNDVFNLIFEPGFSTAAQVTSVSGRGVGMDVVRRHIEKLRGRIEIRSIPGQGATFQLKLPLTLAIIDGLVVGVGGERYIVPLFAVRELLRPAEDTVWTVQGRAEMALVRGSLLPVARLYRVFAVQPKSEDPAAGVLIVAEVEGHRFCVLVDEVIGKQEVVIKTLGAMFKNAPGIAGGAILGDGRVGLILDLDRLYKERTSATEG
jgi:two-component system chemotaxis sensor kinase CheA